MSPPAPVPREQPCPSPGRQRGMRHPRRARGHPGRGVSPHAGTRVMGTNPAGHHCPPGCGGWGPPRILRALPWDDVRRRGEGTTRRKRWGPGLFFPARVGWIDRWVGTEDGWLMRRETPKDVSCPQRLAQHLPLAGQEAIVPPQPRGKARWWQCQAGRAPSSLGLAGACSRLRWVTPDWPWTLVLPGTGPCSRGRFCCERLRGKAQ